MKLAVLPVSLIYMHCVFTLLLLYKMQEARLHAAEQERLRAVRTVRTHVVQSNAVEMAEEKEEG